MSYYSERAFFSHVPAIGIRAVLVEGGKWDGLFRTSGQCPELVQYDRIWLPDDDIATTGETIDQMFDLAQSYGLALCQPALSRDSYFTHFIFNQCRAFALRYVNHIEIMVPCLSRDLLKRVLPYFQHTMSGFGLDYIWCRWPESGPFRAAILDGVTVHHTRPIGSQLRRMIKSAGSNALDEEKRLRARFKLVSRIVPLAYAGISADGQVIVGGSRVGWIMFRSWITDLPTFRDPRLATQKALHILKRQCLNRPDLTLLQDSAGTAPARPSFS